MGISPKGIIRAIWNGPFHVGRLSSPVSVGDVLLKILETAWRALVSLIALALAFAAIAASWLLVIEPTVFPPLASKIDASVRYDDGSGPPPIRIAPAGEAGASDDEPFRCTPEYPFAVRFTNQSSETIGKISFEIEAYRRGYSEPVSSYTPFLESSTIIRPGYWVESCWSGPALPESTTPQGLIYRAEIYRAEKVDPALADNIAPAIPPPAPPALLRVPKNEERGWAAKVGTAVMAFGALAAFAVGSFCLVAIFGSAGPARMRGWIDKNHDKAWIASAITHFVLLIALSEIVSRIRPVGEWINAIDRWSRDSGYADGAMVGLFALASLWPLAILWLFGHKLRKQAADNASEE